jgi:hypothetical protein
MRPLADREGNDTVDSDNRQDQSDGADGPSETRCQPEDEEPQGSFERFFHRPEVDDGETRRESADFFTGPASDSGGTTVRICKARQVEKSCLSGT